MLRLQPSGVDLAEGHIRVLRGFLAAPKLDLHDLKQQIRGMQPKAPDHRCLMQLCADGYVTIDTGVGLLTDKGVAFIAEIDVWQNRCADIANNPGRW